MLRSLLPQCLQLLSNIGQRWSEATRCADKLKPLLERVLSAFLWRDSTLPFYDDASIAQEIQLLLFSDKSLAWNNAPLGDINFDFEEGSMFLDNILINDTEFLQWAPDWDIMP